MSIGPQYDEFDYPETRRKAQRSMSLVTIGVVLLTIGLITLGLYFYLFTARQDALVHFPGGCAKDYLSDERYSNMLVEIDYVTGRRPDLNALNNFEQSLGRYVSKDTVEIRIDDSIGPLGTSELDSVEEANRDFYTESDTVVLYVIYASGQSLDDSDAVGVTYTCSSIAVYKDRIFDLINPANDPDYVQHRMIAESNILVHEFGHVAGLINEVDFQSEFDHEDLDNPNHSKFQNSIMYFQATETVLQDFDTYDRADMKAISEEPYPALDLQLMYLLLILVVAGAVIAGTGAALRSRERREMAASATSASSGAYATQGTTSQLQHQGFCQTCGNPLTYIRQYDRWYCYSCKKYI
jgi:hypothetical protein